MLGNPSPRHCGHSCLEVMFEKLDYEATFVKMKAPYGKLTHSTTVTRNNNERQQYSEGKKYSEKAGIVCMFTFIFCVIYSPHNRTSRRQDITAIQ